MADRPNRPNRPIRPRQGAPAGRRKRRVVIDTGAARPRQDGRQRRDQQEQKPKEKTPVAPLTGPVTVEPGAGPQVELGDGEIIAAGRRLRAVP